VCYCLCVPTKAQKHIFTPNTLKVKHASHWHGFSSSSGVPNRAPILVARSLSRRHSLFVLLSVTHKLRIVHEMRDTQCHACTLNNFVVTSRDTLEINFRAFQNFRHARHATHYFTIATHLHAHCHEFFPHWHAKLRAMA